MSSSTLTIPSSGWPSQECNSPAGSPPATPAVSAASARPACRPRPVGMHAAPQSPQQWKRPPPRALTVVPWSVGRRKDGYRRIEDRVAKTKRAAGKVRLYQENWNAVQHQVPQEDGDDDDNNDHGSGVAKVGTYCNNEGNPNHTQSLQTRRGREIRGSAETRRNRRGR